MFRMIEIYYDENEPQKSKINVNGDNIFDLMASVASIIDGIINVVTVKNYLPEDRSEVLKGMKALLLEMMTAKEGTDIEGFEENFGINEIDE